MLEKRVLDTIKKYNLVESGESVIVGISGGPDSVCLLHTLCVLAPALNITIYAAHVNHMLRGETADADEDYVKQFCAKMNIPLFIERIDIKKLSQQRGISVEEAGREARYKYFDQLSDRQGAAKIAVAHNINDQAETVLMNIIRGTGLDGLKGMSHKRDRIIRPLLDVSRKDIERYCEELDLHPRIDETNLEAVYTRNKIRLDLIPYIDRLFETNIADNITRLSYLAVQDLEFIENNALKVYNHCVRNITGSEVVLDLECLNGQYETIKNRVIRSAVKAVKGDLKGIEHVHVEQISRLAAFGRTGAVIHLPGNIRVSLSYGTIKIFSQLQNILFAAFDREVNLPGTTAVNEFDAMLEASIITSFSDIHKYMQVNQSSKEQFFDYEKLKTGINIRSRKNGDVFKPFKSTGTKKLKEYFIDSKIPRDERDSIPLIANKNEIVWIIGYKISDKFKVTENTKTILCLKYRDIEISKRFHNLQRQ